MINVLNFDKKLGIIEYIKFLFFLIIMDIFSYLGIFIFKNNFGIFFALIAISLDLLTVLLNYINRKFQKPWLSVISLFLLPIFRLPFVISVYLFVYSQGYSNKLFFLLVVIYLLAYIIPFLLNDKGVKINKLIKTKTFTILFFIFLILFIPNRFATRFVINNQHGLIIAFRTGIGAIFLGYYLIWLYIPILLKALKDYGESKE